METLSDSFMADLYPEEMRYYDGFLDGGDSDDESYEDLDNISKLQKSQHYIEVMQKVEDAFTKKPEISSQGIKIEDDPVYQLILECTALLVDIKKEIAIVRNVIRYKYRFKYPGLGSLVRHPVDHARVVKKIGNETDLTRAGLQGLLPPRQYKLVLESAPVVEGKPLQEEDLQKTIEACDRAMTLDSDKKRVLDFVEGQMGYIAPNLSALVGTAVAAKLMAAAGSLHSLAEKPDVELHIDKMDVLEQAEIYQSARHDLDMELCASRLLSKESIIAAFADHIKFDPKGSIGRAIRDRILWRLKRWKPAPLPVPASKPKKKKKKRAPRKTI